MFRGDGSPEGHRDPGPQSKSSLLNQRTPGGTPVLPGLAFSFELSLTPIGVPPATPGVSPVQPIGGARRPPKTRKTPAPLCSCRVVVLASWAGVLPKDLAQCR